LEQCVAELKNEERAWADIQALLLQAQQSLTLAEFHEVKCVDVEADTAVVQPLLAPEILSPESEVNAPLENPSSNGIIPPTISGTSLAEKLSEQRLLDLKSCIGINDRVRWASVFSNGDVSSFMGLCTALENCANYESAQAILNDAVPNIDWEDEDFAGIGFLLLVKRLF